MEQSQFQQYLQTQSAAIDEWKTNAVNSLMKQKCDLEDKIKVECNRYFCTNLLRCFILMACVVHMLLSSFPSLCKSFSIKGDVGWILQEMASKIATCEDQKLKLELEKEQNNLKNSEKQLTDELEKIDRDYSTKKGEFDNSSQLLTENRKKLEEKVSLLKFSS